MSSTNYGKSGLALMITGSADQPQWFAIGSGSGTFVATVGSLFDEILSERVIFSSRDSSTTQKVTLTFDRGSTTMSGVLLKEFGVGAGSTIDFQDLWMHEHFAQITFDGTNELQVDITFEVF